MAFNSLQFLFFFLPLSVLILVRLSRKAQPAYVIVYLLLVSLLYYSFFQPLNLVVLLISISFNYLLGKAIADEAFKYRRIGLGVGIIGNLLLLGAFKYAGFVGQEILHLPQSPFDTVEWLVPVGLSFYTFTQIAYLIDAYSGSIIEKNPVRYALFVSFFPYITAGPILRYEEVRAQFYDRHFGKVDTERLAKGLTLVAVGLFKKVFLAANLANLANPIFSAGMYGIQIPWWEAVVGGAAYSFQIYFDFAGYSDIAVGLGWIFGLSLPWNFNSPYKALNIADFWLRWHISLSNWLRTYLFTPITFSLSRMTRSKTFLRVNVNTWAYIVGTMVTMLVCGLWHNAGWTFIVWGLMHGVYLVANQLFGNFNRTLARRRRLQRGAAAAEKPAPHSLSTRRTWLLRGTTFAAVTVAWVVFRAPSLEIAGKIWGAMLGGNGGFLPGQFRGVLGFLGTGLQHSQIANFIFSQGSILLGKYSPLYIITWMIGAAVLVWGFPNTREWIEGKLTSTSRLSKLAATLDLTVWKPTWAWSLIVAVLTLMVVMYLSQLTEFIYFRF